MNIFSVKDNKANYFTGLLVRQTIAEAIRDFKIFISQEGTLPHQFPEDYSLFRVAEVDFSTGVITQSEIQEIISGKDCRDDS